MPNVDVKTNVAEATQKSLTVEKEKRKDEFENQEYLLNSHFDTVSQSLALFQDDELFSKPGIILFYN